MKNGLFMKRNSLFCILTIFYPFLYDLFFHLKSIQFEMCKIASKNQKWNFELENTSSEQIMITVIAALDRNSGQNPCFEYYFEKKIIPSYGVIRAVIDQKNDLLVVVKEGVYGPKTLWSILSPGRNKLLVWDKKKGLLPNKGIGLFCKKTQSGICIKGNVLYRQIYLGDLIQYTVYNNIE
jgi:hypothetical protein